MSFRRTLGLVTADINLPFGYTLATWSSGTIAISSYGAPGLVEIFAFLVGAVAAYLACALATQSLLGPTTVVQMQKSTLWNVLSIVVAVVVSAVIHPIHRPILGFLAAGLTSTGVYLLLMALFAWWPRRRSES